MNLNTMAVSITCLLILGGTTALAGGIPDYPTCTAYMLNSPGGVTLVLFNVPDGSGSAFNEAQIMGDGTQVDATIMMTLMDANGIPISDFPAEDMWLWTENGGLAPCLGGTMADRATDEFGETTWANPLSAGGHDSGPCSILVVGSELYCDGLPFDLAFNSPDINGDGQVNLADMGLFSSMYFDPSNYDFSADFFADGVINLADVGRIASGVGTSCR